MFSIGNQVIIVGLMLVVAEVVSFVPVHERPQRVDRNNPSPHKNAEEPSHPGLSLSRNLPGRGVPQPDVQDPSPHQNAEEPSHPGPSHSRILPSRGVLQLDVHTGPSRTRLPILTYINACSRRVNDVKSDVHDLTRQFEDMNARMSPITGQMLTLQSQMIRLQHLHQEAPSRGASNLRSAYSDLEDRVSRLEEENEELKRFLVSFEMFFKRLMRDNPADPAVAPEERLSRLHQYLGNTEAELINLSQREPVAQSSWEPAPALFGVEDSPRPPVPVGQTDTTTSTNGTNPAEEQGIMTMMNFDTNHTAPDPSQVFTASRGLDTTRRGPTRGSSRINERQTPDSSQPGVHLTGAEADNLAAALEQLSAQNSELAARLQTLEQQTAGSNPPDTIAAAQMTSNVVTNELLNKVDRLEQVVALQASSILDDADRAVPGEDQFGTASQGVGLFGISSSTARRTSTTTMNEEDVAIMKDMLEETRDKSSSSRKSAFSVARTTPLIGSSESQRVDFDHVFVNKGRDFVVRNSTFVCERAGFYFITFNLRSYDGLFLGVSLMKNNDVVTAVYTDADSRNVMEGQSVIVHLNPGDKLSLRLGPSERFGIHSNFYKYVTFSGFMIYSGY